MFCNLLRPLLFTKRENGWLTLFSSLLFQWRRDVAFAGFEVPIQMDISAEKMIFGVAGIDPQRRAELIKVSRKFKI